MPNSPALKPAHAVQAVLFDYGKVLTNAEDPTAWASMVALTKLTEQRFHDGYWTYRHDYDRNTLSAFPYWRAVAAHAGTTFTDTQINRLIELDVDLWTNMNQQVVDFAQRLQRGGIRTGILSNIGDAMAHGIIARLPWLSGFYHCTWSYALCLAKPDPAIYVKTAEALHTAFENILFIDDRKENIAAAAALGFQGIRFTDYQSLVRDLRDRGYADLLELGTIPDALQPA